MLLEWAQWKGMDLNVSYKLERNQWRMSVTFPERFTLLLRFTEVAHHAVGVGSMERNGFKCQL